jgi:hypothetical protein
MLKKRTSFSLLLVFAPCFIFCQESDFQTWFNVELSGRFFKKVDYSIAPEIRTWDNSSRVETILCEVALSVPVAKNFDFGLIYRPSLNKTEVYTHKSNRYCLFADAVYKIERFRFSYRGIYQQEFTDYNTSENGHIPDIQHRHKIGIKYNPKKWNMIAFISSEAFFILNSGHPWGYNTKSIIK